MSPPEPEGEHEAAGIYQPCWWRSGYVAGFANEQSADGHPFPAIARTAAGYAP